jgi:transcriptional regulator with XRE-family HTH domain
LFAKRLTELRTDNGLKQKDIAEYLNVHIVAYQRYEWGTREPDYETLLKIAKFFCVTTDYLLGKDNHPPSL